MNLGQIIDQFINKCGSSRGRSIKSVGLLLVLCVYLTGCEANPNSVEGRARALEEALKTEKIDTVVSALLIIPKEEREAAVQEISFVFLQHYSITLASAFDEVDPRWRFDMKGFSIDYLKQKVAFDKLEEAEIEDVELPVTIIEPCKTEQEVVALYINQLTIDGLNPVEDMFILGGSLSISWQYYNKSAQISHLNMVAYNILNKRFYQVSYSGSSLTIKPTTPTDLVYDDQSLKEFSRHNHLLALSPLLPQGLTAPLKITYTAYNSKDDATYKDLPIAELSEGVYTLSDLKRVKKSIGQLELAWNQALEVPPKVGGVKKMAYHLGYPLETTE